MTNKGKKINVQGVDILLYQDNNSDFISLTDIALNPSNSTGLENKLG